MSNASKEKGARAETAAKKKLIELTDHNWQRVPGSGALGVAHKLKGDLYIPECKNAYAVEVKHYKDDQLSTKILTSKNPIIIDWWKQTIRQAKQMGQKPLLIFKHNRSKFFAAFDEVPECDDYRTLFYDDEDYKFYIAQLEEWIKCEQPEFIING